MKSIAAMLRDQTKQALDDFDNTSLKDAIQSRNPINVNDFIAPIHPLPPPPTTPLIMPKTPMLIDENEE